MSDIDINEVVEAFKARIAQLEYDLIIAQILLNKQNKQENTSSLLIPEKSLEKGKKDE